MRMLLDFECPLEPFNSRIKDGTIGQVTNIGSRGTTMKAAVYLKEASALLGLFLTIYLWSLVAYALQT